MKIINGFLVAIIIGITAFLSFFWIGSYERKLELIAELPFSFIQRVVGVSIIGITGIAFLILINFLHDKIVQKEVNVGRLKRIAIVGVLRVIGVAVFGSALFFYA